VSATHGRREVNLEEVWNEVSTLALLRGVRSARLAAAASRLFVTEGDHGVHGGGATGRNVSGDERDGREDANGSEHGRGVVRGEAEEQFLEEAHGSKGNRETRGNTASEDDHHITNDETKNGGARCSEGHSNAEFGLTLAHQEAERAIQAYGCKK